LTLTTIPTHADLALQASGPSVVVAGEPFSLTLSITNQGTLDATGVHFENLLPLAADLLAYSPAPPRCVQRDEALTCDVRDPDSGETMTFTLVITGHAGQPMLMELDPLMPGWPACTVLPEREHLHFLVCELGELKSGQATRVQMVLNARGVREREMDSTASVSANETDPAPLDNTITATFSVQIMADLAVSSALSGPAIAGEPLSYTLTVTNLGPSDADVILVDTLPTGTRLISVSAGQGDDCDAEQEESTTDTVVCNLGRLHGGETVNVSIVVAVDESLTLAEEISHSARVTTEQADPDPSNNELLETIPVSSQDQ
jgi:uncharacterized repeat protein (TIGR01451 family)